MQVVNKLTEVKGRSDEKRWKKGEASILFIVNGTGNRGLRILLKVTTVIEE